MSGRGTVGENALHFCALFATDAHFRIAQYVLGKFANRLCKEGELQVRYVDTTYTGNLQSAAPTLYDGECALHLAVAKNDRRMTQLLLSHGADVNTPFARGEFFEGFLYFGGSVLGFAIVNADRTIFNMLIEAGMLCLLEVCVAFKSARG